MPGGGLHLASSEARRRDGLLRRNLHYILTAIVAVVASVALVVPSVYADPANNAVDGSTQTAKAVSDAENRAGTGDKAWQIVECPFDAEERCQKEYDNVRVRKTVESTGTENEFIVHLQIDKKEGMDEFFAGAYFGVKNNEGQNTPGKTTNINGQNDAFNNSPKDGTTPFYLRIHVYKGSRDNELYVWNGVRYVTDLPGDAKTFFMATPEMWNSSKPRALVLDDGYNGQQGQDPNDPVDLYIDIAWDGFDDTFGQATQTAVNLNSVTDVMGEDIVYLGDPKGDYDAADGVSFDDVSGMLTWAPTEKSGVSAQDGWLNNIAELSYRIRLDVTADGFASTGYPDNDPTPLKDLAKPAKYVTNEKATLNYDVVTITVGSGGADSSTEPGGIDFPVPVVRGLLYDLVATKHDGNGTPLSGAVFGLYNADGTQKVDRDGQPTTDDAEQYTVITGEDGRIIFTDLPWGTYTVKEITPPVGYMVSEESWTAAVCHTTDPETLVTSSATEQSMNAMVEREDSFVNELETVPATIKVAKRISGRDGKTVDAFTFVLTPIDGAPMPAGENGNPLDFLTTTINMDGVKNGDTKESSFKEIPVPIPSDEERTYKYTLTESGDDAIAGLVYSKAKYTVTVTVDADGDVSVGYTPVLDDQGESVQDPASLTGVPAFTNSLEHRLVYQPLVKTLEGRQWGEGDSFTFLVKPEDGKPSGNDPTVVNGEWSDDLGGWLVTVTYNDIPWSSPDLEHPELSPERMAEIVFDVPYPEEETLYKYVVTEVTPAEPEAGMLYSKAQWSFILVANRSNGFHTGDWIQELGDDGTSLNGQGQQPNALVMDIGFVNRMAAVSDLPLTGGRSTARTLLLAGGGVLLVAGAAWLLARRRRV